MIANLPGVSELHEKLGDMVLFNYLCGDEEITGDIDYKHILNRLHNTLLWLKCMTLDGVVLTPQVIKAHLLKAGIKDKYATNFLLSPADKQDVKLMYDLLTSIAMLPPCTPDDPVGEQQSRSILRLVGQLYAHLLDAYTNVDLSLHQQLTHLSAAAHLISSWLSMQKKRVVLCCHSCTSIS